MAEKASHVDASEKQVDDLEARNADANERIKRVTQIFKAYQYPLPSGQRRRR